MSDRRIWIRGGRILDPAVERDESGDVLIEGGVVAATGAGLDACGAEAAGASRDPGATHWIHWKLCVAAAREECRVAGLRGVVTA